MITKEDAIKALKALLPRDKKVYFTVNGDALASGQVMWMFRYFVPKEDQLVIVTPLIAAAIQYRSTDTEYLRIREGQEIAKPMTAIQNAIATAMPEDGIILSDISAAEEIADLVLVHKGNDPLFLVPDVPGLDGALEEVEKLSEERANETAK